MNNNKGGISNGVPLTKAYENYVELKRQQDRLKQLIAFQEREVKKALEYEKIEYKETIHGRFYIQKVYDIDYNVDQEIRLVEAHLKDLKKSVQEEAPKTLLEERLIFIK